MSNATAALMGDNGGGQATAAPAAAPVAAPAPIASAPAAPAANGTWYGQVDETTAAYIQNKGWDAPIKAIESYRNLEKFAGGAKNLLALPGADAEPTAWDEVYNKLGRPESPDKYSIKPAEGQDPELTEWFKGTAHKHGLSDKQAASLFNEWNQMAGGKMQALEENARVESEKAIGDLKREWGQGYDSQIMAGRKAVAALGMNEQQLSNYEAKLGTADMLRLFATLGSKMGEPAFHGGERGDGAGFGTTPAQAKAQIDELKTDKQFMDAYMKGDPGAVSKMKRLMEAAHAGG